MFQFRRFPSARYLFTCRLIMLPLLRFPHSDIRGSQLICSSPRLFAACHVLLRLPVPRHPPCALLSLTLCVRVFWFFRSLKLFDCISLFRLIHSFPFLFAFFACSRSFLLFGFQCTILKVLKRAFKIKQHSNKCLR